MTDRDRDQDVEQYYAVLGLRYGATIDQIKQSRNQLARNWHPDRFTSDADKAKAEDKMKAINLAYDFLKTYDPFVTHYETSNTHESAPDSTVGFKTHRSPASRNLQDPTALVQEARSLLTRNLFSDAIMLLDIAIATQDDYAEAYQLRGELRGQLGQDYGAKSDFRKARHYRWVHQSNTKKEPPRSSSRTQSKTQSTSSKSTNPSSRPNTNPPPIEPQITLHYELKGHPDRITQLRVQQHLLVSASADGTMRVWNLLNGELEAVLPGKTTINTIAISPKQDFLVAGCQDGQVKMWSFQHRKLIRSLPLHQGAVTGIEFDALGNILTTVGVDGVTKVFRLNPASLLATVPGTMPIWSIARLGAQMMTTKADSTLNRSLQDKVIHTVPLSSPVCKTLGVSPDKKWIAVGDDRASIQIFDANQVLIKSFASYGNGKVNAIVFTSDNQYLITAGETSMIQIWKTQTWELFHQWEADEREITALQVTGQFLLSAGSDQVIRMWKLDG
jgi:hypothetical protein